MRHSIPYYIREQLREDRSVYIPGLGIFALKQHSASYNDERTSLNAPWLSLIFSEEEGNEQSLIRRIATVEELSISKATKKLSKYTDNIFNKLINLNKVEIEGVGTLIRESDKYIRFNEKVAQLTDEYNGLKAISLNPIKRISMQNEGQPESKQYTPIFADDANTSKPRRPWWIPIIGGILLALAYILSVKSCDKTPEENIILGDHTEVSDSMDISNVEISTALDDSETEVDVILKNEETDTGKAKTTITTSIGTVVDLKNITSTTKEISSTEKDRITAKGNAKVKDVEQIDYAKISNTEDSVIKSVNYDGKTCIIVVGSFVKPKNALRMMNKVEDMGYKVYSAAYGRYTRVGLQFQCKESELSKYISEARSKLEKSAWYLNK